MQPLGTLLLIVAFFTTLGAAITAIYGAITRNSTLVHGARLGIYANAFLYLAMAAILWHGYFGHDFANKYIATYSDTEMPLIYLFTSFWGGEKGALLFWSTVLTEFSAIAIHQARKKDIAYLGWAAGILMLAVFFYDVLMVFASNPFETFLTFHGPDDGDGLNPLLQNPTMAIHPPSLLTGYIAFTLPFAFGAASLITGRLDDQWAKDTRKWTLVSWLFLTVGLVLGGAWAYEELGWGGFWMWDPVENAGLIPWFTATAFLHSIIIQERRGMLRRWNFSLVCLTFFLTIFGTFLTRSQLIVSIHAFADSALSEYFLFYMLFLAVFSVCLLGWRWPELRAPERIESFLSREAMFVLNNVMLVMCAFIIIWGTLYSKSNEFAYLFAAMGSNFFIELGQLSVGQDLGEPWFNKVMVPAGTILLGLTAIGPLIAWRRTKWKNLRKTFLGPFVLATVPMLLGTLVYIYYQSATYAAMVKGGLFDGYRLWVILVEPYDWFAYFTIYFALFVGTGVAYEFWKGGRVRQRKRGGSLVGNMWTLTVKAKRRYGGYIVHIGVSMAFLGFAGVAFKKSAPETPMSLGDRLTVGDYTLTFVQMEDEFRHGEGFVATVATVVVTQGPESVSEAEVDRVAKFVESRGYTPFHVETRPGSPKITLRFKSAEHRDRLREELYLTDVMRRRFKVMPPNSNDRPRTMRLTFQDMELIQTFPPIIHKQVDEVRRTLAGLDYGRAKLTSSRGRPDFMLEYGADCLRFQRDPTVKDEAKHLACIAQADKDFVRAKALLRESESALSDVLMARMNARENAVEIVTANTGYLLVPEVRRYKKHSNPTTEVAIWSRWNEDVYVAMRPDLSKASINLLAFVNPMVNLLWLGTLVMFLGGLFLIIPSGLFSARARRLASSSSVVAVLAGALLLPAMVRAEKQTLPADQASARMLNIMKCACVEGGETVFSDERSLSDCPCELGRGMRRRVEEYMSRSSTADKESLQAQIDFFGSLFAEDPSNERYLLYDKGTHRELLENTLCTCGCGKMAFSQCPLDCPWQPIWRRKFAVLLALGLDKDSARKRYLVEANLTHRFEQEPFTLAEITLNSEEDVSWMLPVAGGVLATILIISVLGFRSALAGREHNRKQAEKADLAVKETDSAMCDFDKELLADELDAIGG